MEADLANSDYNDTLPQHEEQENDDIHSKCEELEKQLQHEKEKCMYLGRINKQLIEENRELKKNRHLTADSVVSSLEDNVELLEIEENFKMKYQDQNEKFKKLQRRCHRIANVNIKLQKKNKELESESKKLIDFMHNDNEDGMMPARSFEVNEGGSSTTASVILSSVFHSDAEPNFSFQNPFNCQASCVLSVLFFIFEKLNLKICNRKFSVEIRIRLGNITDAKVEAGKCCYTLEDLYSVGLIEKDAVFSDKEISGTVAIDSALRNAIENLRGYQYPALLSVNYATKLAGHCVAIMPKTDISHPEVCMEIYDVQKNQRWPQCDKHVKSINKIHVFKVDHQEAKGWEIKCGKKECVDECKTCVPVTEVGNGCPDSSV